MMKYISYFIKGIALGCVAVLLSCSSRVPVTSVILMIGDGMGPAHVAQAIAYRKQAHPEMPELNMEKLFREGRTGLVEISSFTSIVTDSAAAATAMACGIKTRNNMIGTDPDGKPCESVVDVAKARGKAVGIVSNTRIYDSTPAAFLTSAISRKQQGIIADHIVAESKADVLLNGGGNYLVPQQTKLSDITECQGIPVDADGISKRSDQQNLIEVAKAKGYQFACTRDQLMNIKASTETKIFGIFSANFFPMAPERELLPTLPTTRDMTEKSLEILSHSKSGFFLMIEGGLIDIAAHINDAATQLKETLDFDQAVGVAMEYVKQHPDTLLIVTADHETGGFGFSYHLREKPAEITLSSGEIFSTEYDPPPTTQVYDLLMAQKVSFHALFDSIAKQSSPDQAVDDFVKMVTEKTNYNLTREEAAYVLSSDFIQPSSLRHANEYQLGGKLAQVLAPQTYAVYATGGHTAVPVNIFTLGPRALTDQLTPFIDNTKIAAVVKQALEK